MNPRLQLLTHDAKPFRLSDVLAENAGTLLLPYRGRW